jgi:hypothetical protein
MNSRSFPDFSEKNLPAFGNNRRWAARDRPNLFRKLVIAVRKRPAGGEGAGQGNLDCERHAATTEASRRASGGLPSANDLLTIAA